MIKNKRDWIFIGEKNDSFDLLWNFLRISGKPERVKEVKEKANLDGLVFNFEAFVPIDDKDPEYQTKEDGIEKFNSKEWLRDHWGTISNAVDGVIQDEAPGSLFYRFKTAREYYNGGEYYNEGEYRNEGECYNKGKYPAMVARALRQLYPDLAITWECSGSRAYSNDDIKFDYYDENGGLLKTLKDPRGGIFNLLLMDAENIEKFRKLYCKGEDDLFSFSMIIPEPDNESEEWTDYSSQDTTMRDFDSEWSGEHNGFYSRDAIGPALAAWRYENWGTPSEALYEDDAFLSYNCIGRASGDYLEEMVKEGIRFSSLSFPPFKIYRKMAADGLVFKVKCSRGEGQVVDGRFRYETGSITIAERKLIEEKDVFRLSDKDSYNGEQIIVRNRKHLKQLLECVKGKIVQILCSLMENKAVFGLIPDDLSRTGEKRCQLDKPFDLSFLDVSRVTDMSGLFEGFEISFFHYKPDVNNRRFKYRCQIKLDIGQWDVSRVTNMAHMFDGCENVDFGNLSGWNRSKGRDC